MPSDQSPDRTANPADLNKPSRPGAKTTMVLVAVVAGFTLYTNWQSVKALLGD